MFEQIDRHANVITFVKCQNRSCCEKMEIPMFERLSFQIWYEIVCSIKNSDPRAL